MQMEVGPQPREMAPLGTGRKRVIQENNEEMEITVIPHVFEEKVLQILVRQGENGATVSFLRRDLWTRLNFGSSRDARVAHRSSSRSVKVSLSR
jgi:hypothetical protein